MREREKCEGRQGERRRGEKRGGVERMKRQRIKCLVMHTHMGTSRGL